MNVNFINNLSRKKEILISGHFNLQLAFKIHIVIFNYKSTLTAEYFSPQTILFQITVIP